MVKLDQKNNSNIANERYERLQMLAALKQAVLESTSRTEQDMMESANSDMFMNEELSESSGYESGGKSLTKSTIAGKMMAEPTKSEQERGYTSAIMLGMMSFIIEVIFLAITFFMYQA